MPNNDHNGDDHDEFEKAQNMDKFNLQQKQDELMKYLKNDDIDNALLTILYFKLNSLSISSDHDKKNNNIIVDENYNINCTNLLCNQLNPIRYVIYNMNNDKIKRFYGWCSGDNDNDDVFLPHIINKHKYDRRLLCFEILLREKASTQALIRYHAWSGDDDDMTSVFDLCLSYNNQDYLDIMFKYGYDIDVNQQLKLIHHFDVETWKPIHTASKTKTNKLCRLMIEKGANIDEYRTKRYHHHIPSNVNTLASHTIFDYINYNNVDAMKQLLQAHEKRHGNIPNVNAINSYGVHVNDSDEDFSVMEYFCNQTLIHVAAKKCDIKMIKLLLIYGCDINIKLLKLTALYHSDYENIESLAQKLKQKYEMHISPQQTDNCRGNSKLKLKLDEHESITSVFDILETPSFDRRFKYRCAGDQSAIEKIFKLLESGKRWFPEMIEYYPNYLAVLIKQITQNLQSTFPTQVLNIIIDHFCNVELFA